MERKCDSNPRYKQFRCIQCKTPLDDSELYHYYGKGGVYICDSCADVIANCYSKWHSGEFLTWSKA